MSDKKSILINQIQQLLGVEGVSHICISPEEPDLMLVEIHIDPESVAERLISEEIALRNYNSALKRGQISDETQFIDFIIKINEEMFELKDSFNNDEETFDPSELADISLVCDAMALHYAIDLQAEKEAKMLINEQITD